MLLAAVDHHIPQADRHAMREIVAKGDLPVFIQVEDLEKTFESLRAAGTEILQEPVDQPYGVRDAAVRDPSGNHLRLSQPLGVGLPALRAGRRPGEDLRDRQCGQPVDDPQEGPAVGPRQTGEHALLVALYLALHPPPDAVAGRGD